ncbi:MAG: hypothetical protein ACLUHE_08535 [Christensenellales bacterium]
MAQRLEKNNWLRTENSAAAFCFASAAGIGAMLLSLTIRIIAFRYSPGERTRLRARLHATLPRRNTALFDKRSHQRADESTLRKRAYFRQ